MSNIKQEPMDEEVIYINMENANFAELINKILGIAATEALKGGAKPDSILPKFLKTENDKCTADPDYSNAESYIDILVNLILIAVSLSMEDLSEQCCRALAQMPTQDTFVVATVLKVGEEQVPKVKEEQVIQVKEEQVIQVKE
ncbi:hypothetical protein KR018_007921 [Drosophila ironensis]|nr:hypothetical protein KR018_007921 [Drosophila ironensis]